MLRCDAVSRQVPVSDEEKLVDQVSDHWAPAALEDLPDPADCPPAGGGAEVDKARS